MNTRAGPPTIDLRLVFIRYPGAFPGRGPRFLRAPMTFASPGEPLPPRALTG